MTKLRSGLGGIAVAAGLALAAIAGPALAQGTPAGVAAGVNPTARGTPPGLATRVLSVGLDVLRNERIQTEAQGQVQIHFVDRSTLTVGPNSDLVIDEFVYAPATNTGRFALSTSRGLLRVVGGAISKQDEVTVTTPAAVIGIRGGVMLVEAVAAEAGRPAQTTATFLYGLRMRVLASTGEEIIIRRPGFSITIIAGQAPPKAKREVLPILDMRLDQLEARGGGLAQGGAGGVRISALLEQSEIPGLGSGLDPRREAGLQLAPPIIPRDGTRITPEIETQTTIDGFGETRRDAVDHADIGGGGGGGGGPVTIPSLPTPPGPVAPPSTPTPPSAPN